MSLAAQGYTLVIASGIGLILLAIWTNRYFSVNNSESFMVAGRSVPAGIIAASIIATELWAGTIMASAEGVYNWGVAGIWMYALPTGLSYTVFAFIAPRVRDLLPSGMTIGGWIKTRFDSKAHITFTLVALYILIVFALFQVVGGAIMLNSLFGVNYQLAAVLVALVFTLNVIIGGLWSSVVTDYVQYVAVGLIVIFMVPWLFVEAGGPAQVYSGISQLADSALKMDFFRADAFLGYFAVTLGGWGVIATLSNSSWQRVYAVEKKGLRKALLFGGWGWVPIALTCSLVGLIGLSLDLDLKNTSEVFPQVVQQLLPQWAMVFFATAVLLAVYSSGDTYLNGIASMITNDLYKEYINKNVTDKQMLKVARITALVVAVVIVLSSIKQVSLLQLMLSTGVMISAPFFPLVLSLWWKKTSSWAVTLANLVTIGTATYMLLFTQLPLYVTYISSYIISFVVTVVVSLLAPDQFDFDQLKEAAMRQSA
ncbi:sodium:solute symporter family protein [Brevibacillus sp. H7]|uniref:sodium:solute symporter family protein n=1 Tax=Brevibacillus sp. H7 TaxID=3349138 RepID=UPI0038085617